MSTAVDAAQSWLAPVRAALEPRLDVMGIADLNPANILWDGRTCRLVDFEDGGLTDPVFEFADHVEHLASRLPGVFDVAALAEAAEVGVLEDERLVAGRALWACFWLAMLLPGNGAFHRNPPGTTEDQARHVLDLIDAGRDPHNRALDA